MDHFCRASLSFSLKNAIGRFFYDNTVPIPTSLVSQSTSKSFSKSGKAKIGVVHNFSFRTAKVVSTFSPQWNLLQALGNSHSYTTQMSDKEPIEGCQPLKTPHFSHCFSGRPFPNNLDFLLIHLNPITTQNKPKK